MTVIIKGVNRSRNDDLVGLHGVTVLAPDKYSAEFQCPKEAGRTVWKLTHLHFHC